MYDIFSKDELKQSITLTATEQKTITLIQKEGKFVLTQNLPMETQFSMNRIILSDDFDKDGNEEILLLGNQTANRLKMGAIQANKGMLLKQRADKSFEYVNQVKSGLKIQGDVKSALTLKVDGKRVLLIGASDQPLQAYSY
jgi:enediyne biosynthesis protein E4